MSVIIEKRVINYTVSRDDDDLSRRKAKCSHFRSLLKKLHISGRTFSRLSRVPEDTVYSWTSKSDRCIPPNPTALLLLELIDRDRSILTILSDLTHD
jgi:DNA-binding transcriptional regulator YiaG